MVCWPKSCTAFVLNIRHASAHKMFSRGHSKEKTKSPRKEQKTELFMFCPSCRRCLFLLFPIQHHLCRRLTRSHLTPLSKCTLPRFYFILFGLDMCLTADHTLSFLTARSTNHPSSGVPRIIMLTGLSYFV
jgi:hypothetical protein